MTVLSDNYLAGQQSGEAVVAYLTEKYGEPSGTVLEITGNMAQNVAQLRGGGFQDVINANEGIELITQIGDWEADKGVDIVRDLASAEDLDAIPGLGPALAQRIIDFRQAHGPFKQVEDLREVSGVGPESLQKLKPYLGLGAPEAGAPPDWKAPMTTGESATGYHLESPAGRLPGSKSGLGPKTPGGVIDPNLASQAALETLPGIGPVLAQRIIDYRRAHGPYKTIADLRKVSGIGRRKLEKMKPYLTIAAETGTADGCR